MPQGRDEFIKEWKTLPTNGLLGGYAEPYITYDNRYIKTLWWLLKQLACDSFIKGYHTAVLSGCRNRREALTS